MASQNHQYVEFQDNIVSRYRKTCVCAVSGVRINPANPTERLSFLLESKFSNFDIDTKQLVFDYEDDILELYSETEAKVFQRLNPYLFQQGLLEPYFEQAPSSRPQGL